MQATSLLHLMMLKATFNITSRMYVCLCRAVTDRQVRHAVRAGACSIADVIECTRAGTCCGGCHSTIEEIIDEEHDASASGEHRSLPVLASNGACA